MTCSWSLPTSRTTSASSSRKRASPSCSKISLIVFAGLRDDQLVGVDELLPQPVGQPLADRRLAAAAIADQDDAHEAERKGKWLRESQ